MRKIAAVAVVVMTLGWLGADSQAQTTRPTTQPTTQQSQEILERQFAQTMTGATLVGRFTENRVPRPRAQEPREERYTLTTVRKLYGDNWLFVARIQYGDKDVSVPIMLPVKWAGDTPIITLTDMKIPGLGTYTARVIFYGDEYAGMWSGGTHGGHMFGKIERAKPSTQPTQPTPPTPEAKTN
jgi:hypothetical protein